MWIRGGGGGGVINLCEDDWKVCTQSVHELPIDSPRKYPNSNDADNKGGCHDETDSKNVKGSVIYLVGDQPSLVT